MAEHLKGYCSGIYYFKDQRIRFSTAITVWCMFYLKKSLKHPHKASADKINKFLGEEVLLWKIV